MLPFLVDSCPVELECEEARDMVPSATQVQPLPPGFFERGQTRAPQVAPDLAAGLPVPRAEDLDAAASAVREHIAPTPAFVARRLSAEMGREVWVKYESASDIRSFKHRGAIWAVHAARSRGVESIVTASTGNHGQGVALAGRDLGVPITVFTPEHIDPVKRAQMQVLGADIRSTGRTLTDAEAAAKRFAEESGASYIEDGENPELMAGAATVGSEILSQVPEVDTIVLPVGGGNLAAGVCLAVHHGGAAARVVGVQSTAASGVTASWLAGEMAMRPCDTLAGGLATEHPGRLALAVLAAHLDAMCLVDEESLWAGVATVFDVLGVALELAAIAPFVALDRFRDLLPGQRLVLVASGACVDRNQLVAALSGESLSAWRRRTATG